MLPITCRLAFVLSFLAANVLAHAEGNKLIRVLESGDVAFGSFVREKTPEGARELATNRDLDFVFYDSEREDLDVPTLTAFLKALRDVENPHSVLVRIAPIHDDPQLAREHIEALIEAGADGVALPHIMSASEAKEAVGWIETATNRMWPGNPEGDFVTFLMIEDKASVENAEAITATKNVSIFSPGPGSLRGAYEGDMDAVQAAVTKVLNGCKAASVPCANTASESDVEAKVKAGFRLLIAMGEETLRMGRQAAGR